MKSGIYTITNIVNNKIYVGYATNLNRRKNHHFSELRLNVHKNIYLQSSYNKHGACNFIFEIIEECDSMFLASQENYWCNMLNSHNKDLGYNIRPTNPCFESKHSLETKIKIGLANKGRKFSEEICKSFGNGNRGKNISLKHKESLINSNKKPIIQYDLNMVFIKEWDSVKSASLHLNIEQSCVAKCARGHKKYKSSGGFKWKYKMITKELI